MILKTPVTTWSGAPNWDWWEPWCQFSHKLASLTAILCTTVCGGRPNIWKCL